MLPEVSLDLEWRGERYENVTRGLEAVGAFNLEVVDSFLPIARKVLRDYMEGVVGSVRQRVDTPYPSGTSPAGAFPGTLSKRSGALERSLNPNKIAVRGNKTKEVSVSFTLTGVASVHERGATIRAKNAQYLTIPLPRALDKRGVPLRRSARDWKNTFVAKSKRGNLLIFLKEKNKITPLYVLKKSVRIPPRLSFGPAFEAGRDFLADQLATEILREFNS